MYSISNNQVIMLSTNLNISLLYWAYMK